MGRPGPGRRAQLGPAGVALTSVRIIGAGRAGESFAVAWEQAGLDVVLLGRDAPIDMAAHDVDALLIATPDRAIAQVAAAVTPGDAVVLHCSGATGLDAVAMHPRYGSIHPLMALPDAATGAARLQAEGWFAIAGDPLTEELVQALGGRSFTVTDADRALYHATAAIGANHLVALLGQVERLAARVGVPADAFFELAAGSMRDVIEHGAAQALTGPASRGDLETLDRHRAALPAAELGLYDALAAAAQDLAEGH